MRVLEDPETRYRNVLADFTKRAIDEVLPVRAARKADAVDVMMRVDRLTFSRPAGSDPSIGMLQLVPIEPLNHAVLVPHVGAQQKHEEDVGRPGSSQAEIATDDHSVEEVDVRPRCRPHVSR